MRGVRQVLVALDGRVRARVAVRRAVFGGASGRVPAVGATPRRLAIRVWGGGRR